MIIQKSVTPRDIQKLEEVYTEAHEHCAKFYLPHTFKAGNDQISMCWQGRIDRAQTLTAKQPDNEVLTRAYTQLCQQADTLQANANKAREWYLAECKRLNQQPKSLPQDGDCHCDYCRNFNAHFDLFRVEIELGGAIHDFVCGPARLTDSGIAYDAPEILTANDERKIELLNGLVSQMRKYQESCIKSNQNPEWAGVAYGWKKRG